MNKFKQFHAQTLSHQSMKYIYGGKVHLVECKLADGGTNRIPATDEKELAKNIDSYNAHAGKNNPIVFCEDVPEEFLQ